MFRSDQLKEYLTCMQSCNAAIYNECLVYFLTDILQRKWIMNLNNNVSPAFISSAFYNVLYVCHVSFFFFFQINWSIKGKNQYLYAYTFTSFKTDMQILWKKQTNKQTHKTKNTDCTSFHHNTYLTIRWILTKLLHSLYLLTVQVYFVTTRGLGKIHLVASVISGHMHIHVNNYLSCLWRKSWTVNSRPNQIQPIAETIVN